MYNLTAFNPTCAEIPMSWAAAFPGRPITWETDKKRQAIVDSWPPEVDDERGAARWDFAPLYDFPGAFEEYLIPTIRELNP